MNIKKLFRSQPRCRHIRPNGDPCKATPPKGKDYCFFHDPARAAERLEGRQRGGLARCNEPEPVIIPPGFDPGPLETHDQIEAFIDRIGTLFTNGEMDVRTARKYIDRANTIIRRMDREDRKHYLAEKAKLRERRRQLKAQADEALAKGKVWITRPSKTTFYIN